MAQGTGEQLARLFGDGSVAGLTDGQLLDQFITRPGDAAEAAFEALVARHGPMVARVCRGCLRDEHDVEDAFQATFLVLVRRAGAIGELDLLGPWLYGVAHRVARKARAVAARRRGREGGPAGIDPPARLDSSTRVAVELAPVLHEEVDRLPARYRDPVILCHLQGMTHAEAAQELAWPVGTVSVRLARARKILADRLTRRGVTASTTAVATTLAAEAAAALAPASWVHTAAVAALTAASGLPLITATTTVSAGAVTLARRTSMTLLLSAWKWFAIPTTVALATATGAVLVGSSGPGDGPPTAPTPTVTRAAPPTLTPATTPTPSRIELSGTVRVIEQKSDGLVDLEADNMVIHGPVADLTTIIERLQKSDPKASYQLRLSGGTLRYRGPRPPKVGSFLALSAFTQRAQPELAVDLTGPAVCSPGQRFEYTLRVTNSGTAEANAVQTMVTLPTEGGKLAQGQVPPWATFVVKQRQLIWRTDQMRAGETVEYKFLYEATNPGQYRCIAEVVSEPFRGTDELVTTVAENAKLVDSASPVEAETPPVAVPPAIVRPDGRIELGTVPPNYFNRPAADPSKPGSPQPVRVGQMIEIEVLEALPGRPITGQRVVRADGTISLGFYGDLLVLGLNRDQIKAKLLEKLRVQLNDDILGLVGVVDDKAVANPFDRNNRVYVDDQPTPPKPGDPGIEDRLKPGPTAKSPTTSGNPDAERAKRAPEREDQPPLPPDSKSRADEDRPQG